MDYDDVHVLPDGTWLTNPQPLSGTALRRGQWIQWNGEPWLILDLRVVRDGARLVHLAGRPPVVVPTRARLRVFTASKPTLPPGTRPGPRVPTRS